MAFLVGTATGGLFLKSSLSTQEASYSPVFDTDLPLTAMWNLLPDFYRLMDDREVIEAFWQGTAQVVAADLLNLWQVDYAKSHRDVPVQTQRKWICFDLLHTTDFLTDPSLTRGGLPDRFVYEDTALSCTWVNRGGIDRSTLSLGGVVREDASLRWSFTLSLTSVQSGGVALAGYLNSTSKNALRGALLAGVVVEDGLAYPLVMHVDDLGLQTFVRAGVALSLSTAYRFSGSYSAHTGIVSLDVIEVTAVKLSGTTGATPEDDDDDTYTGEFSDDSNDFEALGIVAGDILALEGVDHTISSVVGHLLTFDVANLPADANTLSYEIRGEDTVLSLSLNIPDESSTPSFSVDSFGVCSLDMRLSPPALGTQAVLGRKKVMGVVTGWSYLDPVDENSLLHAPRLQDAIKSPTEYLYEGTDYTISESTIKFKEPPSKTYWAEYATYDEQSIQNNFGSNVGLLAPSSDAYKAKVRGLHYAYYRGPTITALKMGVHILIGLPIAEAAGTVDSINPDYSGVYGQLVVDGKGYLYPTVVGTPLTVGDEVSMFQPLANGVEVQDYINSPRWWEALSDPDLPGTVLEVRKYHSFAITLNMDAFDIATLAQAAEFVDTAKPTWKDSLFIVYKALSDDVDVQDDLEMTVILGVWDTLTVGVLVRYDSADYEGDAADWRYDQVVEPTDLDTVYTGAATRNTSTACGGYIRVQVNDLNVVGIGTDFESDLAPGLQGITVDVGVAGSTDATGTVFTGDGGETFLTSIPNVAGVPSKVTHVKIASLTRYARVDTILTDATLQISPVEPTSIGSFQSLVALDYEIACSETYVIIGRYFFGTAGTTTDGEQEITEVGAYVGVQVGDVAEIDGATYKVQAVTDDTVTLDGDTDTSHAGDGEWAIRSPLNFIAVAVDARSVSNLLLSKAPTSSTLSGSVLYHYALVDNNYLFPHYDQFDEVHPEEDLEFTYVLSPTYVGALPLVIATATGNQSFTEYSPNPGSILHATAVERSA